MSCSKGLVFLFSLFSHRCGTPVTECIYLFRYKQRGKEAVVADNVFPHVTYEGMVNVDKITDPVSTMHSTFILFFVCNQSRFS
jgi:hypothetical protein